MKEELTIFYAEMYRIRTVEQLLLDSFSNGLLSGTTHTSIGQEVISVGVINALNKELDVIFSNHRCHGHYISYSEDVVGLFGELLGKRGGVCSGLGGSQHLQYKNFYTNGIQGSIVPVASGIAYAEKIKKSGAIAVVFIGDGTMGEGVVYEALNMASLWELPIMIVLENNGYAQSSKTNETHAGSFLNRARAFEIKSLQAEAVDPEQIYTLAKNAIDYVRKNSKPFFMVMDTYRLGPHSKGDDFRDIEEIEFYQQKDPLILLKNKIEESGISLETMEQTIRDEVFKDFERAKQMETVSWESFKNRLI
jgi:TPP-dependent pyruvate/acetoin dehydrogenase alpha subunit